MFIPKKFMFFSAPVEPPAAAFISLARWNFSIFEVTSFYIRETKLFYVTASSSSSAAPAAPCIALTTGV